MLFSLELTGKYSFFLELPKLAFVIWQTFPLEGESNQSFLKRTLSSVLRNSIFSLWVFLQLFSENKGNYIRIEIIKKREKMDSCCWLLEYSRIMSVLLLFERGKKLSYTSQSAKIIVFVRCSLHRWLCKHHHSYKYSNCWVRMVSIANCLPSYLFHHEKSCSLHSPSSSPHQWLSSFTHNNGLGLSRLIQRAAEHFAVAWTEQSP